MMFTNDIAKHVQYICTITVDSTLHFEIYTNKLQNIVKQPVDTGKPNNVLLYPVVLLPVHNNALLETYHIWQHLDF